MSSEEEMVGPPALPGRKTQKTRITWRKQYLSVEVSKLGHHLDKLSHRYVQPMEHQRLAMAMVRRGALPLRGLPRNAYDDAWFSSLQAGEQAALQAKQVPYDFSLEYK